MPPHRRFVHPYPRFSLSGGSTPNCGSMLCRDQGPNHRPSMQARSFKHSTQIRMPAIQEPEPTVVISCSGGSHSRHKHHHKLTDVLLFRIVKGRWISTMTGMVLQEIGLVCGSASCLLLWLSDADNVLDPIRLVDARIRTADRQPNLVGSLFRLGRQQSTLLSWSMSRVKTKCVHRTQFTSSHPLQPKRGAECYFGGGSHQSLERKCPIFDLPKSRNV